MIVLFIWLFVYFLVSVELKLKCTYNRKMTFRDSFVSFLENSIENVLTKNTHIAMQIFHFVTKKDIF